jgi:hypothetical protein
VKTIAYRGGLVTFRIPDSWVEEYGDKGGGTFYEDRPDSGTLRLNVLTFESKSEVNSESIRQSLLRSQKGDDNQLDVLSNGNVLSRYTKSIRDEGSDLIMFYWELGNPLPPRTARLAIFSYTILASQQTDASLKRELEMLEHEIKQAAFSTQRGSLQEGR